MPIAVCAHAPEELCPACTARELGLTPRAEGQSGDRELAEVWLEIKRLRARIAALEVAQIKAANRPSRRWMRTIG